MKKYIAIALAVILASVALPSCTKSDSGNICGTYHFKMSGNFMCQDIDCSDTTVTFVLSSQTGQMHIFEQEDGLYYVSMSVMLGGNVMVFDATYENNVLRLCEQEITVGVKEEGSSSITGIQMARSVSLNFSGTGKMYGETLKLDMSCSGEFGYDDNMYVVTTDQDIVCVADKN